MRMPFAPCKMGSMMHAAKVLLSLCSSSCLHANLSLSTAALGFYSWPLNCNLADANRAEHNYHLTAWSISRHACA